MDDVADTSGRPLDRLDPVQRRRLVRRAALVSTCIAACSVAAYYLAPLEGGTTRTVFVRVACSLAILVAVVVLAIRAVDAATYPVLTVLTAMAGVVAFAIVAFAATYRILSAGDADAFSEALGHTDALYFAVTTATTVGFGDIAPRSEAARIVVMIQMVVDVVVIGLAARALMHTARRRVDAS